MRTFSNLGEAVTFLGEVIARKDWKTLARACHEELPTEYVLANLQQRHESRPLSDLYAGWQFPTDAREFKLGGHDKELGYIHIDFVKSRRGWQIKKIWMCR